MVAFAKKNAGLLFDQKAVSLVRVARKAVPGAVRGRRLGRYGSLARWFSKSLYVKQPTAKDIDLHASLAQRQALLYEKRLGVWGKIRRFFATL